jgi:hypothetical protein
MCNIGMIHAIVRQIFQGGATMVKVCGKIFPTRTIPALVVLILLCTSTVQAGKDDRISTVHAIGSSQIYGSDMSAGRNSAIAASLVSAVTKVLTELAPPDIIAGHFQVISENILAHTDRFLIDYKMLTESTFGKQHRVMVRASVSVQRLKKALKQSGVYVGERTYPTVLYCIAEKQVNDLNFQYWWDGRQAWQGGAVTTALNRISDEKGLLVVPPNATALGGTYASQLSIPEAVALGREMQADVVVIGTAVAQETANTIGSSMQSYRGSVQARAYRVDNGLEIGFTSKVSMEAAVEPLSGGNRALEKASLLVGEDLAAQIIKAWSADGDRASKVELRVEGISGNIANFVKFRGALSTMSGVDSVQRKEIQSDTAVLFVEYQGNIQALADALLRQNFDTFSLKIAEPEKNILRMQLVSR